MAHNLNDMFRLDFEDGDAVRVLSHYADYDEYSVEVIEVVTGNYPYKGQVIEHVTPDRFFEYIPTPEPEPVEDDQQDDGDIDVASIPGVTVHSAGGGVGVINDQTSIQNFVNAIGKMTGSDNDDNDDSEKYDPVAAYASSVTETSEVITDKDGNITRNWDAIAKRSEAERELVYIAGGAREGKTIPARTKVANEKVYLNAVTSMDVTDWALDESAPSCGISITVENGEIKASYELYEIKRYPREDDGDDFDALGYSEAEQDSWSTAETALTFFVVSDDVKLVGDETKDFYYVYKTARAENDNDADFLVVMENNGFNYHGRHNVDGVEYVVWSKYDLC